MSHVWGPILHAPYVDGAQCERCGLVASAWNIARDRHQPGLLPACKLKMGPGSLVSRRWSKEGENEDLLPTG